LVLIKLLQFLLGLLFCGKLWFFAQNSGNGISGVQISKFLRGGGMTSDPLIMRGFAVRHGQGFRLDPRLIQNVIYLNARKKAPCGKYFVVVTTVN
jgi:hypothetical protein